MCPEWRLSLFQGISSSCDVSPSGAVSSSVAIDTSSLWVPQCCHDNTSDTAVHESWITGLVTSLLDSGGVSEQVLLLVKPVCQVKVGIFLIVRPPMERCTNYRYAQILRCPFVKVSSFQGS